MIITKEVKYCPLCGLYAIVREVHGEHTELYCPCCALNWSHNKGVMEQTYVEQTVYFLSADVVLQKVNLTEIDGTEVELRFLDGMPISQDRWEKEIAHRRAGSFYS